MNLRLAVVKNIITPYTTEFLETLAAQPGVDLLVLYEQWTEATRHWATEQPRAFDNVVLASRSIRLPGTLETILHVPRAPLARLMAFQPDAVVASGGVWSSIVNWRAGLAKQKQDWAFVPWWGQFRTQREGPRGGAIDLAKRGFLGMADGLLAYSERALRDARRLGAGDDPSAVIPNVARTVMVRKTPPSERRQGDRRYLYAGQLSPRKNIPSLLEAFKDPSVGHLWLAGDGPLRAECEMAARTNPRIRVFGFLEPAALDEVYAVVDALVLPSLYEVWGLVVNEALAHGIPVVVTPDVGAREMVADGVTGLVSAGDEPASLVKALRAVQDWERERFVAAMICGRERASEYSADRAASLLVDTCARAAARRGR